MRILFFLMLCMSSLSAQKVGVVDVDSVLLVMPERAALDTLSVEIEAIFLGQIGMMQQKMLDFYESILGYHGDCTSPVQLKKLEDSLQKLQGEYQAYMSSIEDFQFTLERKIKAYQDGVLYGAVTRVAIVGNYQYILPKKEFLYFDVAYDLSNLVIAELYRRPRLLLEQNVTLLSREVKLMIQEHFLGKEWLKN